MLQGKYVCEFSAFSRENFHNQLRKTSKPRISSRNAARYRSHWENPAFIAFWPKIWNFLEEEISNLDRGRNIRARYQLIVTIYKTIPTVIPLYFRHRFSILTILFDRASRKIWEIYFDYSWNALSRVIGDIEFYAWTA